jgi:hypothetical protein
MANYLQGGKADKLLVKIREEDSQISKRVKSVRIIGVESGHEGACRHSGYMSWDDLLLEKCPQDSDVYYSPISSTRVGNSNYFFLTNIFIYLG